MKDLLFIEPNRNKKIKTKYVHTNLDGIRTMHIVAALNDFLVNNF